jgi:hypothetical protein
MRACEVERRTVSRANVDAIGTEGHLGNAQRWCNECVYVWLALCEVRLLLWLLLLL